MHKREIISKLLFMQEPTNSLKYANKLPPPPKTKKTLLEIYHVCEFMSPPPFFATTRVI